jgi:uncharacterized protein (TIGR02453 family)
MSENFPGFPNDTLEFLDELRDNNTRLWFNENKSRYEASVLEPSLHLIRCLEKPLSKASPFLDVVAKKVGGSLMRIYKDTRFSTDKTPYKTNIGIQFRHAAGKNVHAPGIYVHIEPSNCFVGAGVWRPDSTAINSIRSYIEHNESAWKRAVEKRPFSTQFSLYDDRLKSAPRGYAKDHSMIMYLRLKSFLGMASLSREQIESDELIQAIPALVRAARPLMVTLCEALELPY